MPSGFGLKLALPRSKDDIRSDTYLLRLKLGLEMTPCFPIVHFLENVLPLTDPLFCLEVVDDAELPGRHAEMIPHEHTIRVRISVYEAAIAEFWWARSILAHELGHYYYHDEYNVRYAKLDPFQKVPPDFDPERQANVFAAELLAPIHLIKGLSKETIGKEFGVSYAIAKGQLFAVERVQQRQERKKAQSKAKRSGKKPDR